MLCIRCGSASPGQGKLCGRCGAVLPRSAGDSQSDGATLDVSYPNDALAALSEEVDLFFQDQADSEDVEQKILILEQRLSTLLEDLQPTLEALRTQPDALGESSLSQQIVYLVEVGVLRFNDAIDGLYQALEDEDDEAIEPLLTELAAGNDNICHAGTLLNRLLMELDRAIAADGSGGESSRLGFGARGDSGNLTGLLGN